MYLKEFTKNRAAIFIIMVLIVLSYVVYLCNEKSVIYLTSEDNLYEGGTALFLLISSVLFFIASRKNIFMILLGLFFFFGAGEEISWGQRIFEFETPESIKENIQNEFNVHNLPTFNGTKVKGTHIKKVGLERLTEINFLYRVFILSFGILLPLITYHMSFFKKLIKKLKVPVPPVSLGLFFVISWMACKLVLRIVPKGYDQLYYNGVNEIWEFLTAFIIFNLGIYFYKNRDKEIFGMDIKDTELLK